MNTILQDMVIWVDLENLVTGDPDRVVLVINVFHRGPFEPASRSNWGPIAFRVGLYQYSLGNLQPLAIFQKVGEGGPDPMLTPSGSANARGVSYCFFKYLKLP